MNRKTSEEKALRESEERYKLLWDTMTMGVMHKDTDGKVISMNPAAEYILGRSGKELVGKTSENVEHPSMREDGSFFSYKDHPSMLSLRTGKRQSAEMRIFNPHKNKYLWINVDAIPLFLSGKEKPDQVYTLFENIDEHKKSEDEIKNLASFPKLNPNPIVEADLKGNILYQNPAALKLFSNYKQTQASHPFLANWENILKKLLDKKITTIKKEITVGEKYYQKIIHYLKDQKKIRIYGTDITERKKEELELYKLNRTLLAISNSNQLLMKSTNEINFLNGVCKIIVESCGYDFICIGYAQNDDAKSVKPIAWSGFEEGYLKTLNITWADKERGQGPTGTAIRTGEISMCRNMDSDPKFLPWREEALKRGYASSIVLPIKDDEKVFGAMTIYSKQPNPFLEKEIILLTELANDVSFGITLLRTKQAHAEAEKLLLNNEAKLQTEKNILGAIMDNTQAGIAYIDRDFNFVTANSVYCVRNGRTLEELFNKNYFDFFPSEENKLLFEKVRDNGEKIEFKQKPLIFRNQPWQGITYWDWTITPVKNSEGYVYGLVVSTVDVSERIKSIEDLKMHGSKLEQITFELEKVQLAVENASDIIFITDNKGEIIYINKAIKNITGYKQNEFIGKKLNFWMKDTPNKFFENMWHSIYFNKEPFIGEIQEKKKSGDIFTAEIRIAPVLDKNGQIISFVGIERDITEIKKLDIAKTEFISLAAHQLRTPITNINLTAEMLLNKIIGKMNKESEEHLIEIIDGVKKMSDMIELFLNVSRIEMKTFEVMPHPINMAKIIDENIKMVMPQIKNRGLNIRKNIPSDLPIIDVDPKIMNIILENLLTNAIKYTSIEGLINVEAEKFEDTVVIKISDTGYGIPKKYQEKVFEKLFRIENASQNIEGVGLGLYLCKSLLEQIGGKIWLKSEINKGSTFYVSMPLSGMKKINKTK